MIGLSTADPTPFCSVHASLLQICPRKLAESSIT